MDRKAFYQLTNGLYIAGAAAGDKRAGCVVNTVLQVTSTPAQLLVAVNKENFTCGVIKEAGAFSATILTQDIDPKVIGTFGFTTSADTDKFSFVPCETTSLGSPYTPAGACAMFGCKVVNTIDAGTHLLFIGEVVDAEVLGSGEPLTYAYYHSVLKGKTPKKASSYNPDEEAAAEPAQEPAAEKKATSKWRCTICQYEVEIEGDELPADYKCPICGMGADKFVRVD